MVLLACLTQIQTALRHKSEIEHHRNKIRLRAKRRGHYEFPVVDDLSSGDTRERHRVYRRAQMQIDKILDPTASVPSVFIEPRKRWELGCGLQRDRQTPGRECRGPVTEFTTAAVSCPVGLPRWPCLFLPAPTHCPELFVGPHRPQRSHHCLPSVACCPLVVMPRTPPHLPMAS